MTVVERGRTRVGVLVVAAALLLAGCTGGDGHEPGVGSPDAGSPVAEGGESSAVSATVECLRDRGWEIVVDDEGWAAPGVAETQFDAYVAEVEECTRLNETIEPLEDISQERWEKRYAAVVESAQCLRGQGYDIPETPGFQAWKDSFFVDGGEHQWVPWGFVPVPSMSGSEFRALEEICPQVSVL